ncbi:MAG: ABC transporter substrate-binding protein [Bosea sp.]|jgi:microcin C transport system substrate-binding protein|nr:ABC transporter substrate-binding protein [Bosea sp. (in: a-proteobacteria)]
MTLKWTRRDALAGAAATLAAPALLRPAFAEAGWSEVHGLSTFGELGLPADFRHFAYVNPAAAKGGNLVIQLKSGGGNQSFDTFNTLNSFVDKGDGVGGTELIFDSLVTSHADEPLTAYGLLARSILISPDKLKYRFNLRPEARFHNGTPVTADDVAFSLNIIKTKGHSSYRLLLRELESAVADDRHTVTVTLSPAKSRDLHLLVGSLNVFSRAFWEGRDFEAAILEPILGSGPYRMGRFEQGRYMEYDRVPDYWARDLPVNVGLNNFDRVRYEYFRDRNVAFEAFKAGTITFEEEYTARQWATGYDFPALREGRVKREELPRTAPMASQGWYFNTRREMFRDKRIREALNLCFDFEWTNRNIMFGLRARTASFFEKSDKKAEGLPSPEELALLEPFRATLDPEVFGEPWTPPVSDGSGNDRALLRRANDLLLAAGCKREGAALKLPGGKPFEIEFLDSNPALHPHTQPFIANLKRLGIEGRLRTVDPAQYQRRTNEFDFDMVSLALGGSQIPGDTMRLVMSSEAARTPGSRNYAGIANPAIDALLTRIANATSYKDVVVACRALDRVFRAGRYWVPMWHAPTVWLAYWDMYDRPAVQPKFGEGAPGTWWFNPEKARRVGRA